MRFILLILLIFTIGCSSIPRAGTYNDDSITWDNTKWDCNWTTDGRGMDCELRKSDFKSVVSDNVCSPESEYTRCYNTCRDNSQNRDEMDLCPRNCHRRVCLDRYWLY